MFGQHDDGQMNAGNASDNTGLSNDAALSEPSIESTEQAPSSVSQAAPDTPLEVAGDDLLEIKQHALSQLSPLVSHLDQSPEERFHTLMMMIQASDNQNLIMSAYEAASQISDDKQKAQALLDIVNEINYFTHPQNNN